MGNLYQEYVKRYEQAHPEGGAGGWDWIATQWMQDNGFTSYKSEGFHDALMRVIDEDTTMGGVISVMRDKLMREEQVEENRKLRLAHPDLRCAHECNGKCDFYDDPISEELCGNCPDFCVTSWQWDKYIGEKYPESRED